jgi:hypothetical protein
MDTPWHNWLFLGSESPNFFCFALLGIIWETFNNKKWRAGSPQSLYSLAQLTSFGFRVSQHYLFCIIWDFKTFWLLYTFKVRNIVFFGKIFVLIALIGLFDVSIIFSGF